METPPMGTADLQREAHNSGRLWALPLVLAVALGVTAALLVAFRRPPGAGPDEGPAAGWTPAPEASIATASLAIDFGNGARREFAALAWAEGMTVGDLLRVAREFQPGLAFSHKGAGASALLTSIDGVANGAVDGRFWLYEVNGRSGDVSFEIQPVATGDRILWAFKLAE
jgi:hypothetical protein